MVNQDLNQDLIHIFSTIGIIRSPYKVKSTIPRQPNLVRGIESNAVIPKTPESEQWIRGIESFSHLWIIFLFNKIGRSKKRPVVQIPVGREHRTLGVFATRSPYRPNPIGISAVELIAVKPSVDEVCLVLRGADLLDGTPILDIKPYLPYADCIPNATSSWANEAPSALLSVNWSDEATEFIVLHEQDKQILNSLRDSITDIVAFDPRPFHYRFKDGSQDDLWSVPFGKFRIFYKVFDSTAHIVSVKIHTD